MCVICVLCSVWIVLHNMSRLSYLHTCLRIYLFFIYLFIWLITRYQSHSSKNPDINNTSNAFYGTQSFKNLIQVITWYLCKNWKNTFITAFKCSLAVRSQYQISKCISVQSNTCYIRRPSHPHFRSTVQNMRLLVTMFSSDTFSLLHPHLFLCINLYLRMINYFVWRFVFVLYIVYQFQFKN